MRNKITKLLSMLLAAAMIVNLSGVSVLAAEPAYEIETGSLEDTELLLDDAGDISTEDSIIEETIEESTEEIIESDVSEESYESVEEIVEVQEETADSVSVEADDASISSFGEAEMMAMAAEEFAVASEEYVLTTEQYEDKDILAEHFADAISINKNYVDNEEAYVLGEVVYVTDTEEDAEKVAKAFGGTLKEYSYRVATIQLPEEVSVAKAVAAAAYQASNLPAVWPNYYREATAVTLPTDPYLKEGYEDYWWSYTNANVADQKNNSEVYQWMHTYVGDKYAWAQGYKGQGVRVAVVDTGVQNSHKDLVNNTTTGKLFASGAKGTPITTDNARHGTHVAGIIAGDDNGVLGCGIAPDAKLTAYTVLGADGKGSTDDGIRALNAILEDNEKESLPENKIQLINMSLGGAYYEAQENDAINALYESGVAIFAAAGNEALSGASYPASYKNAIRIASVSESGALSSYSNYSESTEFAFPGKLIYSCDAKQNNMYTLMSGTSMACPAATGTAAVILSANPKELQGKTGKAKVDALKALMRKGATKCASDGVGAGTTYIPNALGITVTPQAPSITVDPSCHLENARGPVYNDNTITLKLELKYPDPANIRIYFNSKGKTPSVKNGVVLNAENPGDSDSTYYVDGTTAYIRNGFMGKSINVKAIAYNVKTGEVSKVSSYKATLNPDPMGIDSVTTDYSSESSAKVKAGSSIQLIANEFYPCSYAKKHTTKWWVSDEAKAVNITVSNKGLVKVPANAAEGNYIIYAQTVIGTKTFGYARGITLSVVKPADVKITAVANTVTHTYISGETYDCYQNVKINDTPATSGSLGWKISNKSLAYIDQYGRLGFNKPGTVKVTAIDKSGSGKSVTFTVKSTKLVGFIVLSGPSIVAKGKTLKIKAEVPSDASNKKLIWVPTSTAFTVNNGVVNTKNTPAGTYSVKVYSQDGGVPESSAKTFTFTVLDSAVSAISLDKKNATIFISSGVATAKTYVQLNATITGGEASSYIWTSSNEKVARVDSTGLVTSVNAGTAVITCQSVDGTNKKASCTVKVNVPASRIKVAPAKETLYNMEYGRSVVAIGKKVKLTASFGEAYGRATSKALTWTSSNPRFTVDKNGNVSATSRAVMGETTEIKAEAADGSGVYGTYTMEAVKSAEIGVLNATSYIKISGAYKNGRSYKELDDIRLYSTVTATGGVGLKDVENDIGVYYPVASYITADVELTEADKSAGKSMADKWGEEYNAASYAKKAEMRNKQTQKTTVTATVLDGSNKKFSRVYYCGRFADDSVVWLTLQ